MKDIKKERVQSLLSELLSEALTVLDDLRLKSLTVTEVRCSRGKYNADVYVLGDELDKGEQNKLLVSLKKAEPVLREYILTSSGWYRCPKLTFKIDESLGRAKNLDKIFEQIKRETT